MTESVEMMAACGIDCGACTIRRMPFEAEAAKEAIGWFRKMGWLKETEGVAEAVARKMVCHGCHGDRDAHWSADCWILRCCVDQKGLRHCHECAEFPCARLVEWSQGSGGYGRALERLEGLRRDKCHGDYGDDPDRTRRSGENTMGKRFGYRTGSFRDWPLERTAAELIQLGYDCVEVCLERDDVRPELLTEARCQELRQALDRMGMGLASVSYHADGEPPDQRRENQRRAVQVARWFGADILVLNAERAVDQPRQWAEHVERFRALCGLAEQAAITIAVEPEPLLVVGSSGDMMELMRQVGSPCLKVNLDIGHAQITDDDLIASILALGSDIAHLHLEDIRQRVHRHLLFGEGDIDLAAVRQALDRVGYEGPYVVDLFGPGMEPLRTAELALAGLRRHFG